MHFPLKEVGKVPLGIPLTDIEGGIRGEQGRRSVKIIGGTLRVLGQPSILTKVVLVITRHFPFISVLY